MTLAEINGCIAQAVTLQNGGDFAGAEARLSTLITFMGTLTPDDPSQACVLAAVKVVLQALLDDTRRAAKGLEPDLEAMETADRLYQEAINKALEINPDLASLINLVS